MSQHDYYQWKVKKLLDKKKRLLDFFYNESHHCCLNCVDTSVVELVIRSNIHLSDAQIQHILGLNPENPLHDQVYNCLIEHIAKITHDIASLTQITDISQLPLTNLFRICYNMAMEYRPLLFCPYEVTLVANNPSEFHLRPRSLSSVSTVDEREIRVTKFSQRFNQNWIIVYLFKKHFALINKNKAT